MDNIDNRDKSDSINTIRALHETVVSLRSALEKSKTEILNLKTNDALDKENQNLKKHIESLRELKNNVKCKKKSSIDRINVTHNVSTNKKNKKKHVKVDIVVEVRKKKTAKMDDTNDIGAEPVTDQQQIPPTVTDDVTTSRVIGKSVSADYLDQELDDIELIFTTDDTKEFKEALVSIEAPSSRNRLQRPLSHYDELSGSDRDLDDDVFNDNFDNDIQTNCDDRLRLASDSKYSAMYDSKSDNSINNPDVKSCYSYRDSSFENKSLEKDESFDRFEETAHIVETDISKVGIQESSEYISIRRNTCPNPLQYRPIMHREALSKGSRRTRPVLGASVTPRRESGAQTDISALPSSSAWRSESSLARKIRTGDNTITTLPSKYPLPSPHSTRPPIKYHPHMGAYCTNPTISINTSHSLSPFTGGATAGHPRSQQRRRPSADTKTLEARRVLLSDIGFTSMVPELSRSADHLAGGGVAVASSPRDPGDTEGDANSGRALGYDLQAADCCSPAYSSQRFLYSPLDSPRYSSSVMVPGQPVHTRALCLDGVPRCVSFLAPHQHGRRCSAPVSPNHPLLCAGVTSPQRPLTTGCPLLRHQCSVGATGGCCVRRFGDNKVMRVRFAPGHSMPDLRPSASSDFCDSGDSTDSLLDETEQFLRRSIDCIADYSMGAAQDGARTAVRRASAPEPHRDNIAPLGWHPFLPRHPRDLRPDYWVKAIGPEGRVRGGRVRYVGAPGPTDAQQSADHVLVGVQLSNPDGQCDGVWNGRRYFQCEPNHGLFVPFKKIVMGWKP